MKEHAIRQIVQRLVRGSRKRRQTEEREIQAQRSSNTQTSEIQETTMSLPARRRLRKRMEDSLSSLMPTHTIIAAGRTETVDAPYVLVSCPRAEETTPGSLTYLFFLRIAPISNVADSDNADAHDALAKRTVCCCSSDTPTVHRQHQWNRPHRMG